MLPPNKQVVVNIPVGGGGSGLDVAAGHEVAAYVGAGPPYNSVRGTTSRTHSLPARIIP
jgi:hypothetical protein